MALPSPVIESCPNHPDVTSGLLQCARCGNSFCADCLVELEGKPYDANCKEEQIRDLRSGSAAPPLATSSRRFVAMWVDSVLLLPVWVGAVFLWGANGRPNPGPASVLLPIFAPLVI